MNLDTLLRKLPDLQINESALEEVLSYTEKTIGTRFPDEYRVLMRYTNGVEGPLPNGRYLALWRVEELIPFNEGYLGSEFAAGLFLFGSNGGGTGYAFDLRTTPITIVDFPLVSVSDSDINTNVNLLFQFILDLGTSPF